MKNILRACFLALLVLLPNACGSGALDGVPGIEGFIVKKDKDNVLVVSAAPYDPDGDGGNPGGYDAIWFSSVPEELQVGDKVQVWYRFVLESYPGQSVADKLRVLPSRQQNGSDLSEAQALSQALQTRPIAGVPIVQQMEYDEAADLWKIVLKEEDVIIDVRVEDR